MSLFVIIYITSSLLALYYRLVNKNLEYAKPLAYFSIFISFIVTSLHPDFLTFLSIVYSYLVLRLITSSHKVNVGDGVIGWSGRERNNKMDPGHYLKYFKDFSNNYKLKGELEEVMNSGMFGDGGGTHWAVTMAECPSYKGIFSSLFQGRAPLSAHDTAHMLLGRGFNLVDEIAVVAVVMGSTKKVGLGRTIIYYIFQWLFYPKWLRLPLGYFELFYSYVKFGKLIKKDLSKIKGTELDPELTIHEFRDSLGIFRDELLPYLKKEVLEYGVNSRIIEGMILSQADIAMIEHSANFVSIFSRELAGDLTDYDLIYSVSNNLTQGKIYKWVSPNTEENQLRKNQVLELHNNNSNASIVLIDEVLYNSKFEEYEEYVSYNNRVKMAKNKQDEWIVIS